MQLSEVLLLAIYSIEVVGFFVIAALVFLRRRTSLNVSFAIFSALVGFWQALQLLSQIVSRNHQLAAALLHASVALAGPMVAMFLVFALLYSKRPPRAGLYLTLGAAAGVLTIWSPSLSSVAITITGIGVPTLDIWYAGLLLFGAFCILAGAIAIGMYLRKGATTREQRRQGGVLLVTMIVAGLSTLSASFYTSEFSQSVIGQHILPTVCLFGMLTYAYIIYRGLFDVHFFAVRALAYLTTLFVLVIFFVAPVTIGLAYVFGYTGSVAGLLGLVLLAVTGVYALQHLRTVFDRLSARYFYRQFYNPQDVLDEIGSVLVSTIDLAVLDKACSEILAGALKPHAIALVIPKVATGHQAELAKLVASLSYEDSNIFVLDEHEGRQGKAMKRLVKDKVAVAVRLTTSYETMGYLLLGYKQSGEAYDSRDRRLLNTAADELALAIQNALRFEEIRQFNETLQQKVDEATARLRRTNAKLRQLDEAKDEFVSMASHQLRTPLTSVKGYLSLVLEGDAGPLKPAQRKMLTEAFNSSQRMVYLIADFLNVSRLKTGKFMLEYGDTDMAAVVADEVQQLQSVAESRGLKLRYKPPAHIPRLRLDETKLRQVVMNLIDNAIYYSKAGTEIVIELYQRDAELVLKVKDQGIGVPKAEQHGLFDKFFRATNARKTRPDGTGIGLYMIKKVVDAHGGSILFESVEGKGSTFGFTLPLQQRADSLDQQKQP